MKILQTIENLKSIKSATVQHSQFLSAADWQNEYQMPIRIQIQIQISLSLTAVTGRMNFNFPFKTQFSFSSEWIQFPIGFSRESFKVDGKV